MRIDGLILAGGRSRRMGRDKAELCLAGQTLLARQIALARAVGCETVLISAARASDYAGYGCPVVADENADAGPLGGIERGLEHCAADLLLVLAVDLPALTSSWLRKARGQCLPKRGMVPVRGTLLEPLAAFYPKATHALARAALHRGDFAVVSWVGACERAGWVARLAVASADEPQFRNCNCPADLPGTD